ncbi:unnamed protein product [Pleuronectes platessa]|uniref:Uncharacterized protein n=1 Tax=Pleuronectes platessa TaxID=8262 RepID=A0A9N7TSV6_PLEPL|nr:unnamed protein product [Pleuronectes platessa]
MWGFIGAPLLLSLPWRARRTRRPRGQRDWPSLAHIVKVDKLAAGWGERLPSVTTRSLTTSLTFSRTFPQSAPCLYPLVRPDPAHRSAGPIGLVCGATILAGAEKSSLT